MKQPWKTNHFLESLEGPGRDGMKSNKKSRIVRLKKKNAQMWQESQRSPLNFASGTLVAGVAYQHAQLSKSTTEFLSFLCCSETGDLICQGTTLRASFRAPSKSTVLGCKRMEPFFAEISGEDQKHWNAYTGRWSFVSSLRFTVGQNLIPGHTSKNCYPKVHHA